MVPITEVEFRCVIPATPVLIRVQRTISPRAKSSIEDLSLDVFAEREKRVISTAALKSLEKERFTGASGYRPPCRH